MQPARRRIIKRRLGGALLAGLAWLVGCATPPPTQTTVGGQPVLIDRLYPPGQGPVDSKTFSLLTSYPQKLWLTGAEVVASDADTGQPVPGLLTALTVGFQDANRHRELNKMQGWITPSLFHTAAGMSSVALPPGFGIPVMSNEVLHASSVWQNRDLYRQPLQARADVTLRFSPAEPPLKEVRPYPVYITIPIEKSKLRAYDIANARNDAQGRPSAARWWIPPGPSAAASEVSYELPQKAELTVRMVTGFAYEDWTRLELEDLTDKTTLIVFEPSDRSLSRTFPEGLKLDTQHRLQLSVAYNNPARVDHVGTAMMVLYCDPYLGP